MLAFLRPGPSDSGNARAFYRCSCGREALVRVARAKSGEQMFCGRWCSAREATTPAKARATAVAPSFEQVEQVKREAYRSALRARYGNHNLPANASEARKASEAFANALRERGWLHEEGYAR